MNNKEYKKQHYLKNRDLILEKRRKYKEEHRERLLSRRKLSRDQNKEQIKEYRRLWRIKNKEKIAKQRREYREQYLKDPKNKLINSFRGQIKRALSGNYKSGTWRSLLGCSVEDCKLYLESQFQPGMAWENHGDWHIDHVRPISSYSEETIHLAFHFTNLQPLWALDNLTKGSKFEK